MNLADVREWSAAALEFVYPPLCLGCEEPRESAELLCRSCATTISYLEYPLCLACTRPLVSGLQCQSCAGGLRLIALGDHVGPLQAAVIGLKFRQVRRVANWAATEILTRLRPHVSALNPNALVPVPLHSGREYFRGFNQAAILAECLGDGLGIDIRYDLAVRTKHRRVQSRQSGQDRFRNVRGVFEALPCPEKVDRIVIVDDVVTSGATVGELARVLAAAGHSVVGVISIAHRG